jgi:acyl-homoserine lactone acylase PvdQ
LPALFVFSLTTAFAADPPVGHYQGFGDARGFLNVLPPGTDGSLNGPETIQAEAGTFPPHFIDQLEMYAGLIHASPGLTEEQIFDFFKDASFGVREDDIDRIYSPIADVTVIRDNSSGTPHIFGTTRYATMFAQGYTAAEDRLFLMDILRHVGRGRMSEFLGGSPGNQHMDRDTIAIAPYKEEDLTQQLADAVVAHPDGPAVFADLEAYVDGVNQYINEALVDATKMPAEYPALQQVPQAWKNEDAVAIASLVGGIFGKGGGGELLNHCGIKRVATELGSSTDARQVFDDFKFADDAEAPTTSRDPFPYLSNLGAVSPSAHPDVDCDSLVPIDPTGPPLEELLETIANGPSGLLPGAISNAMLISGEHTASGRPIAVFGPQTGYFAPQLLIEKDVHGPGIDARGASFSGVDLYVQLGRGRNYAWSATSAGGDNVDQFVLELCEPGGGTPTTSSMGYLRNGNCEPIETYQHVQIAKPSAGGIPAINENGAACNNATDDDGDGAVNDGCPPDGLPELLTACDNAVDDDGDTKVNDGCLPVAGTDLVLSWRVERTAHYGPLVARGTLENGTPIAISTLRTTYNSEPGSALGFYQVNNPDFMTNGFDSVRDAMGKGVEYTFNWFYIDSANIGFQHSCKCPQRAQGVDPYLPAWGNGSFDWQGMITFAEEPWDLNPTEGYLTSWNNKQAPGFVSNDRNFSYGPVYRSQMFDVGVEPLVTADNAVRTDMIDAMASAATMDLRALKDLPLLLTVLGPTAPGGSDPRVQDMRDRLAAWDMHRRDFDDNGAYDDAQSAAIMDAWWPRLSHAIFDAESGHAIDNIGIGLDDGNRRGHLGSAFQDGTYGHVNKDLRQVLGQPVVDPFSRTYCGAGVLADCRTALWDSLEQAAADLEAEFSDPDVADWKRAIADEDIRATTAGIVGVPAIDWQNRPTFQQVVQIGSVDHYKCYRTRRAAASAAFGGAASVLADLFETKSTNITKPVAVCAAVDKNGEGVGDPTAHLACYRIKDAAGQPKLAQQSVSVGNQFGGETQSITKAATLCVPAELNGVSSQLNLDRFKCYKSRTAHGTARFTRRSVTLDDGIDPKITNVIKPSQLCDAVDEDGAGIGDAAAALACYRIKDASGQTKLAPTNVSVDDQFGGRIDTLLKPSMLCVPSIATHP